MTKYNSYIKIKCKCSPECESVPTISCFGYNYNHLPDDLKEKAGTKKAVQIKNRNKRSAISRKLHAEQKKVNKDDWKLESWFTAAAKELSFKPFCMECGDYIPKDYYRHATAHILPKRERFGFPSMSVHPKNKLFLGAGCGCHHKYDSSWEAASKMKVWPIAVAAFKEMYPYIPAHELKNIPNVLLETLLPY